MNNYVSVKNEIGKLKRVMLHRPGTEMEHFTPRQMEEMLFDDIPWVARMREEHDAFALALRKEGTEVVYLEDFLKDCFAIPKVAEKFVDDLITKEMFRDRQDRRHFRELFLTSRPELMTTYAISGIYPRDMKNNKESLSDHLPLEKGHVINPLPNLYFSRDGAAAVGTGIIPCCMNKVARQREGVLTKMVFDNHPCFTGTMLLYNTELYNMPVEGGDILVLSDKVVVIGCSQRTSIHAVDYLARQILNKHTGFESVLAVHLPDERAFMHLDTVMSMVDPETFVVYPRVVDACALVEIKKNPLEECALLYESHTDLRTALSQVLRLKDVRMILSGGGDTKIAAREQWNDATNTLCVAPGKVIVYNRNAVTNRKLRESGIQTIEIEGSELVRGRGGPRCMSMPLLRG